MENGRRLEVIVKVRVLRVRACGRRMQYNKIYTLPLGSSEEFDQNVFALSDKERKLETFGGWEARLAFIGFNPAYSEYPVSSLRETVSASFVSVALTSCASLPLSLSPNCT